METPRVGKGAPLPLRLTLRAIQPSNPPLGEQEFAHVRIHDRGLIRPVDLGVFGLRMGDN